MYCYPWKYFPARLHSTREIIYFLENINNIKNVIDANPNDLTNIIFGDIYHSFVKKDSLRFFDTNIDKNIDKLILEISSRKVNYYNNIPLSHYYSKRYNTKKKYNIIEKNLSDEEIEYDLLYILKISKEIFNSTIEINIIPHLNLRTKIENAYIEKRNILVNLIEEICIRHNIKIINVGKYLELNCSKDIFLEDFMYDKINQHYKADNLEIKALIIEKITGIKPS